VIHRARRIGQAAILLAGVLAVGACSPPPSSLVTSLAIPTSAPSAQQKREIDRVATGYLTALASGDASQAALFRERGFDLTQSRASAFGRFASQTMAGFSVQSVQGQSVASGVKNNSGEPAWVATVTVGVIESSQPATFTIRIGGVLGSKATVISATADESAR
jgi:hypothetical protein